MTCKGLAKNVHFSIIGYRTLDKFLAASLLTLLALEVRQLQLYFDFLCVWTLNH
jgi:hypothetical protein